MRCFLLLILCICKAKTQIAPISSLLSGTLNGLNAAAGGGNGLGQLLGNIGNLYQLAQTALQLTGTGVGILNQASEGRWFEALLERTASNPFLNPFQYPPQIAGPNLNVPHGGSLLRNRPDIDSLGIEANLLGTEFPPPKPEDYDEESSSTIVENLIEFTTEQSRTKKKGVTLFPEEKIEKKNKKNGEKEFIKRNKNLSSAEDYDEIIKEIDEKESFNIDGNNEIIGKDEFIPTKSKFNEEEKAKLEILDRHLAKLSKLIEILEEKNLTNEKLNRIALSIKNEDGTYRNSRVPEKTFAAKPTVLRLNAIRLPISGIRNLDSQSNTVKIIPVDPAENMIIARHTKPNRPEGNHAIRTLHSGRQSTTVNFFRRKYPRRTVPTRNIPFRNTTPFYHNINQRPQRRSLSRTNIANVSQEKITVSFKDKNLANSAI
ncbi:unnamed protein product [Dracunculus medinensis]|uniref:Uncharacterized protein n=1 Tax=Dracunculus medinensis TaxID=318479 RepID=A0A158Q5Q3_DRAME|nr:unnamed protein product [Dracunculus medinensis]